MLVKSPMTTMRPLALLMRVRNAHDLTCMIVFMFDMESEVFVCPLGGMRRSATTLYGEWRSGKTRKEKRAAKRAKYLGISLEGGAGAEPELFFYGVDSGVVGMKVADVAQTCRSGTNTSNCGYNKVTILLFMNIISHCLVSLSCPVTSLTTSVIHDDDIPLRPSRYLSLPCAARVGAGGC